MRNRFVKPAVLFVASSPPFTFKNPLDFMNYEAIAFQVPG